MRLWSFVKRYPYTLLLTGFVALMLWVVFIVYPGEMRDCAARGGTLTRDGCKTLSAVALAGLMFAGTTTAADRPRVDRKRWWH